VPGKNEYPDYNPWTGVDNMDGLYAWCAAVSNWIWGSVASDDAYTGGSLTSGSGIEQIERYIIFPTNNNKESIFEIQYSVNDGTPAANYFIKEYPSFPDADYARDAVRFESRLEFAMEGHRFFDLVRWGIAPIRY